MAKHVWSQFSLPDPADYYGGYKEPRVLEWNVIRRALSDIHGVYEGCVWGWTLDDTDRVIRGLLAAPSTKWFFNRSVVGRTIPDPARRALLTPRTIFRGVVRGFSPQAGGQFSFEAEDYLVTTFQIGTDAAQIPRRKILAADFPDAPEGNFGRPVPVLYGSHASEQLATAQEFTAVTGITATPLARPAAPTGFTATLATGGRGMNLGVRSFYALTAAFADGTESEPAYVEIATEGPDGNNAVQLNWATYSGAAEMRLYQAVRSDFLQFAVLKDGILTGSSTSYLDLFVPPNQDHFWIDGTDWGDNGGLRMNTTYYVWAKLADGLWSRSGQAERLVFMPINEKNRRRDAHVAWTAYIGALGYRVIRHVSFYSDWGPRYDLQADLPAGTTSWDDIDHDDSEIAGGYANAPGVEVPGLTVPSTYPLAGLVPLTHVGTDLIGGVKYNKFLVAGHAVKSIGRIDITVPREEGEAVPPDDDPTKHTARVTNFGPGQWLVPGQAGWPFSTSYIDVNGHRYTYIFTAQSPPPENVYADVDGIETVGDGSGTLITSLLEQYLHAAQNWLIGDYQAGAWLSTPTFPDEPTLTFIDETSFAIAKAVSEVRVTGGYVGAAHFGMDGSFVSIRDVIQRLNMSCDVNSGFNLKTQFFVSMQSSSPLPAATVRVDQTRDILKGTFNVTAVVDEFFNRVPYEYGYDARHQEFRHSLARKNDESIVASLETRSSPVRTLYYVFKQAVAEDIAERFLFRAKDVPRNVAWQMGLAGLNFQIGDVIRLTHSDGVGADGYVEQPIRVKRQDFDPGKYLVALEGYDVGTFYDTGFVLGDETAQPTTWTAASTAQRIYGYLADEVTGTFSDGAPGKRLR